MIALLPVFNLGYGLGFQGFFFSFLANKAAKNDLGGAGELYEGRTGRGGAWGLTARGTRGGGSNVSSVENATFENMS
jgi:hypothetical protein